MDLKVKKIGLIGAGRLSSCVLGAWVERKVLAPSQIMVSNRSELKVSELCKKYPGLKGALDNQEVFEFADIIFLVTKPQVILENLSSWSENLRPEQGVVSLAAGLDLETIRELLGDEHKCLGRVVTNLAVSEGAGLSFFETFNSKCRLKEQIKALFQPLGSIFELEHEKLFGPSMVATSSGIGLVLEFQKVWESWLQDQGVADARSWTVQTFLGAAQLAQDSPLSLQELQNQVVSPKGLTAQALLSLERQGLDFALRRALDEALDRNSQLESQMRSITK